MAEGLSRIVGETVPHNTASESYSTTTRSGSWRFTASIHAWVAAATSSFGPAGIGDGHARTKSTESRIKVRLMGRLLASDCQRYGRFHPDSRHRKFVSRGHEPAPSGTTSAGTTGGLLIVRALLAFAPPPNLDDADLLAGLPRVTRHMSRRETHQ